MRITRLVILAFVMLGLVACGPRSDATPAQAASAPVEAAPTDPLEIAVAAAATPILHGMIHETPYEHGTLAQSGSEERTLVLERGRCYRIVASGAASLGDLEMTLFDTNAVVVQRDSRDDATAIVGGEDAVCPQEPGAYRLEIAAPHGQGAYAMRVYASAH